METIKVWFCDFWKGFNPEENYFINLLRKDFEVKVTDSNPDFVFFSVFGNRYTRFSCVRVFYTGENVRPNFNEADWDFSFDFIPNNHRHFRLPFYGLQPKLTELLVPKNLEKFYSEKKYFCAFIFSNPNAKQRNTFFKKLSKIKRVDSGGAVFNNLGYRVLDKINFLRKYKFTIAFENQEYPGYTTEKIVDTFLACSIPIYWGNPLIHLDFNPKSFLNYYDFGTDEAVIQKILELDNNDEKYLEYLAEPAFTNNKLNDFVNPENVRKQLIKIVSSNIEPIARRNHNNFFRRKYLFLSDLKKFAGFIKKKKNNFSFFWLKVRLKEKFLKHRS